MSLLENRFFKAHKGTEEEMHAEADKLQKIVDDKIEDHKKQYELLVDRKDQLKATQLADDQELNNSGMADILNKKLEEAPLFAHETELEMKINTDIKDPNIDSNYATKN